MNDNAEDIVSFTCLMDGYHHLQLNLFKIANEVIETSILEQLKKNAVMKD